MTVKPLAVFLMNEEIRRTYRMGQMGIQLNDLTHKVEQEKKEPSLKKREIPQNKKIILNNT